MDGTAPDPVAPRTTTLECAGVDAIEQLLSGAYSGMRIRSDSDAPALRHRRTEAGIFAFDTVEQSTTFDLRVEPLNTIVVGRLSTARASFAYGKAIRRRDVGDIFLAAYPDQSYTCQLLPGECTNCVLDLALLTSVAATAPGRRPQPLRFTSLDPQSPAAAAHWWDTRCYVTDLLDNNPGATTPLVLANAAQLLAAVTLATFPNTALTDPTIEDRRDASPATLRRAVTFIDDNATHDICAADIAAAAHVSIRTIQLVFRRHLDTTPMAYRRQTRLDHAHHHLIAADPAATTVAAIAARFGFASPGRFTAIYRKTYGVLPSSTLHDR